MCFGSAKNDASDDLQPRPVRHPQSSSAGSPRQQSFKQRPPQQQHHHQYQPPQNEYVPPSGPPPPQQQYAPPPGPPPPAADNYAPPPGPPPSASHDNYAPPPAPPPFTTAQDNYAPPSGPPPSSNNYAPPSGPPPPKSHHDHGSKADRGDEKKHDWESVVPDTSLFPPPPAFFSHWELSPTTNATRDEAEAGDEWCRLHPPAPPLGLPTEAVQALSTNSIRMLAPGNFGGQCVPSPRSSATGTVWTISSWPNSRDAALLSYPPLYSPDLHSPLKTSAPKTIYYEVIVHPNTPKQEITLALGFSALPYPPFRMPGWQRGSLAIHGDDGHKYVNDIWGGKDFTDPFVKGHTYGLGMVFSPPRGRFNIDVSVFFTRDGHEVGRWDLHEETDSRHNDADPLIALEGYHDICAAVGTYQDVGFDVIFDSARWKYRPV